MPQLCDICLERQIDKRAEKIPYWECMNISEGGQVKGIQTVIKLESQHG